jgi:Flp pilus assembly protein TadD
MGCPSLKRQRRTRVATCYLNAFQYRFALRQAETACRLAPHEANYRTTLGVAQYRTGRFHDALATLSGAEPSKRDLPAELAFLAMAQYRWDQKEQARATLGRVRHLIHEPRWSQHAELHGFVREAEALIQSR